MSIDYYKCEVCGEIFPDVEFFMFDRNDKYVCEGCCEKYGITWKNQEKFSDEEGYLINNKELLDKLSKE